MNSQPDRDQYKRDTIKIFHVTCPNCNVEFINPHIPVSRCPACGGTISGAANHEESIHEESGYTANRAFHFIVDIPWVIVSAALGGGIGAFIQAIASEAGKDVYQRVKHLLSPSDRFEIENAPADVTIKVVDEEASVVLVFSPGPLPDAASSDLTDVKFEVADKTWLLSIEYRSSGWKKTLRPRSGRRLVTTAEFRRMKTLGRVRFKLRATSLPLIQFLLKPYRRRLEGRLVDLEAELSNLRQTS